MRLMQQHAHLGLGDGLCLHLSIHSYQLVFRRYVGPGRVEPR
jgi:hypothetical protein